MVKLIEFSTEELLKKFGSGEHKPGSGSAAALQGLLAAKLIRTVIELSKKKPDYRERVPEFNRIESVIEDRIYPELLNYFQLDSEQFDRVIKLRRARNKETDPTRLLELKQELNEALMPATETPIAIAKLCAELAGFAAYLGNHGFQAARGDSGVALNNTIATISGCLSIINLNLLSLGHNEETDQIRLEANRLKTGYKELSAIAAEQLNKLEIEAERNKAYHIELQELASGRWAGSKLSYDEIELLARRLQNTLWRYQDKISKQTSSGDLIELLKPQVVLCKILDYHCEELPTLGQHFVDGELFEIAGIIDKSKKFVAVSQHFSKEIQNFTAAHELGHALLHQHVLLHRDKAIDGSGTGNTKDPMEIQADKFATFFLMPKKQVAFIFKELFLTDKFVINQDTIFSLTKGNISIFRKKVQNARDLSKMLAAAEFYGDHSFKSMAKIFSVSKETMAIRMEELGLVEWIS